jgi:hypothetical protein
MKKQSHSNLSRITRRRMFKQSAGMAAMTLVAMVLPPDLQRVLALPAGPAPPAEGWRIWLSHRSNDPSSIVISWQTDLPGDSVVYYGVANEEEHRQAQDENVTLHHVEIPLVKKDCIYQYRVETNGKASPTYSFKGYPTGELRVAVVGDWGWAKNNDLSAIVHDDIHLLITAGDNVPNLHQPGREGLKAFSALIDKQPALFRSTPFMPVIGNHDKEAHPRGPKPPAEPVYDLKATAYCEFFALPGDKWKWRFEVPDFGVCFLALDLEHMTDFGTTWQACHAFDEQSEQFVWYRRIMQEAGAPFVFTLMNEKQTTVRALTKDLWHEYFRKGSALITGFGYFGDHAELDGGLPYFNTCLNGEGDVYKDPQSKFFARMDNYLLLTFERGADAMTLQMKNLNGVVMDTRIVEKRQLVSRQTGRLKTSGT